MAHRRNTFSTAHNIIWNCKDPNDIKSNMTILEECGAESLQEREQYWINAIDCINQRQLSSYPYHMLSLTSSNAGDWDLVTPIRSCKRPCKGSVLH